MASPFRRFPRSWCADCDRRIILSQWTKTHGQVCSDCYVKAMDAAAKDEEMRSLRRYTDAERARI